MYQFCKILSAKMLDLIKFKRFPGLPPPPGRALSEVRRGPRLGETFLCTDDIVNRWRGGALTLYVMSLGRLQGLCVNVSVGNVFDSMVMQLKCK